MSFKDKLKNKVLDNSDMYNHYKNESFVLSNELSDEMKKLKKEIKSLKNKQKKTDEALKTYNRLFNKLYLDYELTPKGALKYTQELCLHLLDFVANVCEKNEITYWLDCGSALGVKRHGGYVPWDDDADISMLRKDYMKFKEVINDEIKENKLENIISAEEYRIFKNRVYSFITIFIKLPNAIFGAVDIFPMDYIVEIPEDIENRYGEARTKYNENIFNGQEKNDAMKEVYETLDLSLDKQEYLVIGVDTPKGKINSPRIIKYDWIFPLSFEKFEDRVFPCPNNLDSYLTEIYGKNFKKIPQKVHFHQRVDKLKEYEGFEEKFEEYFEILKEVNENFEK